MPRRRARRYRIPAPKQMTVNYGEFQLPEGQAPSIAGAYANPQTHEVFVRTPDNFTTAHEAFHLLDSETLTDRDRARFQRILGYGGNWNQGTGATAGGLHSPSELIADNYAALASGLKVGREFDGGYVESYDPKRLRRFARSLERLGLRNGLGAYDRKAIRREALKRMTG